MFKKITLGLIFFTLINIVNGQTYNLNANLGTITTCSGTFSDGAGQYANNSNYTVTFCSGSSALININFSALNLESGWDFLTVYDGPNTGSPQLDNITGNIGAYTIQSSGSCLTFVFTSDGTGRRDGWTGAISCVVPCSPPTAGGSVTNYPSPVKVCLNDVINFSAATSTAAAGFSLTNFDWDFDDGSTGTGINTSHAYTTPGEYIVQVEVTDNNNCTNNNLIDLVVQVGTEPTFVGTTPNQTVCAGQNVCLDGVINPTPWVDVPNTTVAGTTPLPDGSGVCYTAPLTFTEFIPGSTITNGNQVLDVFANLEHTWAGDLSITLQCPNGQEVGLFNGDQTWNTTNISSENFGDPAGGVGYDYTWVNAGSTIDDWGAANPGATTGTSIPSGTYGSEDNFSNLVGCPLNGTWQLLICDWFSSDDGTVFSWGMDFAPSLYAGISGFTPVFASNAAGTSWSGNNPASTSAITSISGNGNQICVTPPSPGTYSYSYTGVDDFGCTYDTTITITATAGAVANAGNDISYCSGLSGSIGSPSVGGVTYSWSPTTGLSSGTAANPTVTLTNLTGSPVTTTYILTTSASGCTDKDTVTVTVNPQPVANFTQPAAQCLTGNSFTFNNTSTNATSYNWNFGDGNTSTTTSPTHTYSTSGTFTVTLTATNGTCTDDISLNIVVNPMPIPTATADSVNCNGGSTGTATITGVVNSPGGFNYSWNSAPIQNTQTATGLPAGNYTVTVTDQNTTCQGQTTVTVFEPPVLSATENHVNPTCAQGTNGSATANPTGGTTNYSYSWNTTPIQTTQTATGLAAGSYTCTITDYNGCTTTTTAVLVDPAGMVLSTSMTQANCGASDGSATVNVTSGGSGNFSYSWNTTPVQNTQTASGIPAGTYIATVTDVTAGCVSMDTIIVTTTIGLTANATFIADALCNGASNGLAYAFPTGGTPGYSYSWNDPSSSTNDTLVAAAGTYTVTITDTVGCQGTANVTIGEPTVVVASITSSNNETCNGSSDGSATAGGAGGDNNYNYSWNTTPVQNTQTATGLAPGTYIVTVTDGNSCSDTASVVINPGPFMTVSHTQSNVSCFGGSNGGINVTVNGAPGAITYNWMPGALTSEDPVGLTAGTYILTATSSGCQVNDTVVITEPTQLVAVIDSSFDVTCNGDADGSAYASASGGTGGTYTYLWNDPTSQTSPNAINLGFGNYTLTVTDSNSCQTTVNVSINEPPALTANSGSFDAYCGVAQGSAWILPTNGTAPYTFAWDSAASPLGTNDTLYNVYPGTYNIQIQDANSCKYNGTVVVNAAPGGSASISTFTDVSCNGGNNGTATVSMSNAFPGYTYLWDAAAGNQTSNPATGLSAGTYSVSITDTFGCVMTTNVTIGEPTPLTVNLTAYDKVCYNSCNSYVDAAPSGGNSSYLWSWNDPSSQITQVATGLCPGMVSVTITDSKGCTVTDSVLINNPPQIVLSSSFTAASCNQADGSAYVEVLANAIAPYTFVWNDGSGPIGTDSTLINVVSGTYFVTVSDSLGCSVNDTVTIPNLSAPVIDSTLITHVSCYGGNTGSIEVFVSGGGSPYTYSWNPSGQITPQASNLSAGGYTVNVTDTNGCIVSTSVTITEPDSLQLTTGGVNPTCFGYNDGLTWVNVNGGTMPYSYSWNTTPIQTNDSAITLSANPLGFTVTVTDTNGCFTSASVPLYDPALFTIDITNTDVSCYSGSNGTATVSENNGLPPYFYSWDDPSAQSTQTALGLVANTYNVQVTDDDGCIANGSIVINEPNELILTEDTVINVSCNGFADGFAAVNVVGGSGAYSFNWDLGGTIVDTIQNPNNLAAGNYLVTVTDTNGCNDQIFINVTEPNPLNATFSTVDVLCSGDNTGLAFVNTNGGTTPYTYQWDDAALQQTDTAFNLTAGTYQVTVTDSNLCSITLTNIIINQPTPIVFNSTTSSPSTCGSDNGEAAVTIGGGSPPFNFSWNDPANQSTAVATNLFAGNYTVVVTDTNGCQDSTNVNVNNLGSPTVTIPTSTNVSCNGASDGTATANVVGGFAPYSYLWSNGDTTLTASNLDALTYSITVTDSNGCTASESVTIQQANALAAVIGTPTNVSCNGGNDGSAYTIVAGGIAPYTYLWSDFAAQSTDTASNLAAGTYFVTVADSNNCLAYDTVTVTEPQPLSLTLDSLKNANCAGLSDGYIDISVSGGTLPYVTYAWTPNVSTGPTASGLAAGNYDVVVTDNKGCTINDNFDISEPAPLVITTDSVPSTCGSNNGSATVTTTNGGTSPYNYSWNDPLNQQTITASGLGASTYTVTVTDANNCQVQDDITVIDNPGPIIDSVNTTNPLCNGDNNGSAQVYVSGNGPFTYTWTPSNQTTALASGLTAGVYSVEVKDVNLCTSTMGGITLSQPEPLTANITMPATACYGQVVQFFGVGAGGTPFATPQPAYDVIWLAPFNTTGQGPFLDTVESNFTYNIVVQDANDCIATHNESITVGAPLSITATDDVVCLGDTANVSANASGGLLAYEYNWLVYDSLTGNTITPVGVSNPTTGNSINLYATDTTDYIVYVSDGCSRNDTAGFTVSVKDTAIVSFNSSNGGCPIPYWSVGFEVFNDNWNSTFAWDFDGNGTIDLTSTSDSVSHAYYNSGTYDVNLTVTTENGCVSHFTNFNEVTIYQVPIANFSSDPEFVTILNPTYEFTDLSSAGVNSWNWNFGDFTSESIQNPEHTYQDTGFYAVTLIVSNGFCEDTIIKFVQVKPDFFFAIPNTFTPDGDGINELFMPGSLVGVSEDDYNFFVYDRWGEKIWEGHNLSDGWDGTAKGGSEIVQTGVYVWKIKLKGIDGLIRDYVGHVNVLK